ncbi:MAG: rRNA pseudouridine synthase [Rhodoferax sp.]|nr:rRNA pseudouridine synthase [Rhodoferax sp.]
MAEPVNPEPAQGTRLAKRVAELKACSRREAEQYIEGGWVTVDGQVVEEPQFRVLAAHRIEIDAHASLLALTPVTLLLHKPPGYDAGTGVPMDIKGVGKGVRPALALITPASHAADDRSDIRPLKKHFAQQTLGVPLESAASGLVVFTQDWRTLRKLTEDAAFIEQEFTVEVAGDVAPGLLERLNHGLHTDGRPLPPVKVSVGSTGEGATRLRFAVKGAHPGLIALLCERVGLKITAMKRIRIGRVPLAALAPGQWRYLLPHERF